MVYVAKLKGGYEMAFVAFEHLVSGSINVRRWYRMVRYPTRGGQFDQRDPFVGVAYTRACPRPATPYLPTRSAGATQKERQGNDCLALACYCLRLLCGCCTTTKKYSLSGLGGVPSGLLR
jgi:hypothetical protein